MKTTKAIEAISEVISLGILSVNDRNNLFNAIGLLQEYETIEEARDILEKEGNNA